MPLELDTFLTATDGIGYSSKQEFYKVGYGFGFSQFFWIELGTEPVTPPVYTPAYGGGQLTSLPPLTPPDVKQIHYIKFYLKTPSGEIVSHRWEIKKVAYKFLVKYIGQNVVLPRFVLKQLEVISNIYHKIKVTLIK